MYILSALIGAFLLASPAALSLSTVGRNVEGRDVTATANVAAACNSSASGVNLPQLQYEALMDFVDLLWAQEDVLTAFDRYVPGNYDQHSPYFEQGRDFVVTYMTDLFKGGVVDTNRRVFAGQGFGALHHKLKQGNTTWAVVDYYKFNGTCLIEHWDVMQEIVGNEPNPLSYF